MSYKDFEQRVTALEQRVKLLESERPGRKLTPIVVSEAGVCGIDPKRNSATCGDANVYRYQKGCRGTACTQIYEDYYRSYRKKRIEELESQEFLVTDKGAQRLKDLSEKSDG